MKGSGVSSLGAGPPKYGFVGSTYKDGPGPVAAPPSSPCGGVAGVLFLHVSFALPSVPRLSRGGWFRVRGVFGALGISGLATGPGPPGYGFASSTYRSGPDPVADPPSYHRGVLGSLGGSGVVGGIVVLHLCLAQGFVSLLGCGSDSVSSVVGLFHANFSFNFLPCLSVCLTAARYISSCGLLSL